MNYENLPMFVSSRKNAVVTRTIVAGFYSFMEKKACRGESHCSSKVNKINKKNNKWKKA